ncbi:MAG: DUF4271 domain-containing protein [Saprospiraceae bacterium]|nr:DUF4271 domain-containing protein [Saprospiraceae bacterium]
MIKGFSHIFSIVIVLLVLNNLFAQQSGNPFELKNRLPQQTNVEPTNNNNSENPFDIKKEGTNSDTSKPTINNNPFNVVHISKGEKSNVIAAPSKPISERLNPFANIKLSGNPKNFIFWVILFMMLTITVLITLSRSFVSRIFQAFFNDNLLRQLYREYASVNAIFYFILYFMFMVNIGILVFLTASHYNYLFNNSQFTTLILCITASIAVFSIKHLLVTVAGAIFPIRKESNLYQFTMVVFGIVLGILLVPANLIIAYINPTNTLSCIIGTVILIGIVYVFRYIRSLFVAGSNVILHKLHFLVYLCTLEIAPFIILLKTIMLQTGLKL